MTWWCKDFWNFEKSCLFFSLFVVRDLTVVSFGTNVLFVWFLVLSRLYLFDLELLEFWLLLLVLVVLLLTLALTLAFALVPLPVGGLLLLMVAYFFLSSSIKTCCSNCRFVNFSMSSSVVVCMEFSVSLLVFLKRNNVVNWVSEHTIRLSLGKWYLYWCALILNLVFVYMFLVYCQGNETGLFLFNEIVDGAPCWIQ